MDVALMVQAMDSFGQELERVQRKQWSAPTPCEGWDVRGLVNHIISELLWLPPLLEGRTIEEVGDRFDGDVLGDVPQVTWASAVAAAKAAVAEEGVQTRTVHLSFGDFPGSEYLGQVTSDLIVHSWDLARAVGGDGRLSPPLLGFLDEFLMPQVDLWRQAGAFGPAADAGPGAGRQERLIAATGRSPGWTP